MNKKDENLQNRLKAEYQEAMEQALDDYMFLCKNIGMSTADIVAAVEKRLQEEMTMEAQTKKEFTKQDKIKAWNFAIGMMQVDGAKPNQEFLDLVDKEINGKITLEEMELIILKKHDKTGRYK